MAGGESKVARLHETPAKKLRKRKPPKASSGLVEAWASEPSEEVAPEPKVPDEVQDSPVPAQGDPAPNFAEGESSQAPSEAPQVATAQDANVLMFGLLQQMTNLVGILTTQLKPNEAAASGSTGAKVVKRLPIKIPPPKAFEGPRLRARCDLVAGGGEFLPDNGRGRKSKGANGGGVVRQGCVDLVGGVYQGSGDCGK